MRPALLLILPMLIGCASAHADTYREAFEADLESMWAKDGIKPAQDRDYFDCLVNESMASFTPAELGRLDVFVSTRNPDLQSEANAIVANRDQRIGGNLPAYLAKRCGPLKG